MTGEERYFYVLSTIAAGLVVAAVLVYHQGHPEQAMWIGSIAGASLVAALIPRSLAALRRRSRENRTARRSKQADAAARRIQEEERAHIEAPRMKGNRGEIKAGHLGPRLGYSWETTESGLKMTWWCNSNWPSSIRIHLGFPKPVEKVVVRAKGEEMIPTPGLAVPVFIHHLRLSASDNLEIEVIGEVDSVAPSWAG